ncbi:MAG: response regulator transcription factor [Gemmobacter sp.]
MPDPAVSDPVPLASALIIDDHPLFCDALSMTLKAAAGIPEIRTRHRLDEAIALIEGGWQPDVIVLDLHLPDVSGLDGLIRLKRAAGRTPVVVVSSLADRRIVAGAIRAGAAGFVPKHSQRDVFRAAFDAVARGLVFTPEGTDAGEAAAPVTGREQAIGRLSQLTRQQGAILDLICAGKLNKQIAHELSIAETTVKAHVTAIMRKLGVQSRTQAVLIAQEARFSSVLHETF